MRKIRKNDVIVLVLLLAVLVFFIFNQRNIEPIIFSIFHANKEALGTYSLVTYTRQFLTIAVISCALSIIIGMLIGIICFTDVGKQFRSVIDKVATVMRSFPDIAMIYLVIPLLGLGVVPTVVALVAHGILPIIFAVTSGIDNISPSMIKAAKGMGMSKGQIMKNIQLPMAMPVIISGMRVSLISCIGGATLGSRSGGGGLGLLLSMGQETYNVLMIMECALLICLMSLFADKALKMVEHYFDYSRSLSK